MIFVKIIKATNLPKPKKEDAQVIKINGIAMVFFCSIISCGCSSVAERHQKAKESLLNNNNQWILQDFKNPVSSVTYDKTTANSLARLCRLVWEEDPIMRRAITKNWNCESMFFSLEYTDTQYMLIGNGEFTALVFRATQSKAGDIFTVLKYKEYETLGEFQSDSSDSYYKDIPAGNAGFRESIADCFASGLLDNITAFRVHTNAGKAPLFITGHSLGGALAILSRPKLEANKISVNSVYVFGAPVALSDLKPIGLKSNLSANEVYANSYKSSTFFHRYDGDNVPRLRPWGNVYMPPGWSKQLNANGDLINYQSYETLNWFTSIAWSIPWLTSLEWDHNLERSYLPALNNIIHEEAK